MYLWDRKHINELINYLNSMPQNENTSEVIETELEILNFIKARFHALETYKDVMWEDEEKYESVSIYTDITNEILNKGYHLDDITKEKYKRIDSSRKNILAFTRDNIKSIDKKWAELLEPHFKDKRYINFHSKHNNTIFLTYLNKVFISLSKENNIEDFITPTHEYFHILTYLLNNKAIDTIEREAIPILGELITTYEMRKKHLFSRETIKADINNFYIIDQQLKAYPYRLDVLANNVDINDIPKHLNTKFNVKKDDIKLIYDYSLDYIYSIIISYFLAIELFEIYKQDKEKCIYICNQIISSNKDITDKLKENEIKLTKSSDKYIKELKKNITIN